jgi:ATP-dependent DNA helicase RecG
LQLITKNLVQTQNKRPSVYESGQNFNDFYQNHLPFELTGAQKE